MVDTDVVAEGEFDEVVVDVAVSDDAVCKRDLESTLAEDDDVVEEATSCCRVEAVVVVSADGSKLAGALGLALAGSMGRSLAPLCGAIVMLDGMETSRWKLQNSPLESSIRQKGKKS